MTYPTGFGWPPHQQVTIPQRSLPIQPVYVWSYPVPSPNVYANRYLIGTAPYPLATNSQPVQRLTLLNQGPGNIFFGAGPGVSNVAPTTGGPQNGFKLIPGSAFSLLIDDMQKVYVIADQASTELDILGEAMPKPQVGSP
jgi:hypothetical protein